LRFFGDLGALIVLSAYLAAPGRLAERLGATAPT
jgi:hypothetical protein